MRLDLTISLGNIITIATVCIAAVGMVTRINKLLDRFFVEHEMLIKDYCDRTGQKSVDLPTRVRR